MKTIILSGRLTADPELKTVGERSVSLANFTIANNEGEKETAEFYDIKAWDKLARACTENLTKGSKVIVLGNFATETYTSKKDNSERSKLVITANRVEFADIKERA
jgi:single-strand DNA-binding protein